MLESYWSININTLHFKSLIVFTIYYIHFISKLTGLHKRLLKNISYIQWTGEHEDQLGSLQPYSLIHTGKSKLMHSGGSKDVQEVWIPPPRHKLCMFPSTMWEGLSIQGAGGSTTKMACAWVCCAGAPSDTWVLSKIASVLVTPSRWDFHAVPVAVSVISNVCKMLLEGR